MPDVNDVRVGHPKREERFCLEGSQSCLDSGEFGFGEDNTLNFTVN